MAEYTVNGMEMDLPTLTQAVQVGDTIREYRITGDPTDFNSPLGQSEFSVWATDHDTAVEIAEDYANELRIDAQHA